MSKVRQERTAEQIQVILSELFLREVGDPRLAGVTITEVLIDRELQHANVYVNALGDDAREEEIMDGLESASGFLRSQIASVSNTRTVPRLRFVYDTSVVRGQRMSALIDAAVKKDRENAPPAANPAADADGSAGGEE